MARLIWSPRALRDLEEICEFIARDSEKYARVIAGRVVEIVERLPTHPRAGSIVPEYDRDDLRERILYSYRIVYRLRDDAIEVVSIVHGARMLPGDLGE
ncbi:MAG: type II toxin-antitoxin system RelE/ParE family toxin [Planctomycetaceae bacterium]